MFWSYWPSKRAEKRRLITFADLPPDTTMKVADCQNVFDDFPVPELEISDDSRIFITDAMKSMYASLCFDGLPKMVILQGASGVGKTTTMLVIGSKARESGCLVFPLQGRYFSSGYALAREASTFISKWINACGEELLASIETQTGPYGAKTLLALARHGQKHHNDSLSVICDIIMVLSNSSVVPVVLLIDQCNAFLEQEQDLDDRERAFRKFLSRPDKFNVKRGMVICGYSSSYILTPQLKDGNSELLRVLSPMGKETFAKFTRVILPKLPNEFKQDDFFALCGGLPREAASFCRIMKENPSEKYAFWQNEYFEKRTNIYRYRIKAQFEKAMHKLDRAELVKESLIFAADIFVGAPMRKVPAIWKELGLVVRVQGIYRLPCPAADKGLSLAFDRDTMRDAIGVFSKDSTIRWRALELGVVYIARQHIASGHPMVLRCRNLFGEDPRDRALQVENIVHSDEQPKQNSIRPGTLFVCPCGYPVIDFFIFTKDCHKVMLQVSESSYLEHRSKMSDAAFERINKTFNDAVVGSNHVRAKETTYVYLTPSKEVCSENADGSPKGKYYDPRVLLVSNLEDDTRAFFHGLIDW